MYHYREDMPLSTHHPPNNPTHRLYYLVDQLGQVLKRTADKALLEKSGITTAQAAALRIIVEKNGASLADIAGALGQRKSAMTTMARRLENAGFVERVVDKHDRRASTLQPTELGEKALNDLLDAFTYIDHAVQQVVDEAEIETLSQGVSKILGALEPTKTHGGD